ncbi:MAG: hypothetical protein V1646_02805 [bacterium]
MKKLIKFVLFLTFIPSTQVYTMQDTKIKLVQLKTSLKNLKGKLTTLSEKLDDLRVRLEFEQLVSQIKPETKEALIQTLNNIHGNTKLHKILTMEKDGLTIITQLAQKILTSIREKNDANTDAYTKMSANIFKKINEINDNKILTQVMTESKGNNIKPFCLITIGFAQYQKIELDLSPVEIEEINNYAELFSKLIDKIDNNALASVLVEPLNIEGQNLISLKILLAPAISTEKLVTACQIILGKILGKAQNFTKTQLVAISNIKISVEELQFLDVTGLANEITLNQFINSFKPDATFPLESKK